MWRYSAWKCVCVWLYMCGEPLFNFKCQVLHTLCTFAFSSKHLIARCWGHTPQRRPSREFFRAAPLLAAISSTTSCVLLLAHSRWDAKRHKEASSNTNTQQHVHTPTRIGPTGDTHITRSFAEDLWSSFAWACWARTSWGNQQPSSRAG